MYFKIRRGHALPKYMSEKTQKSFAGMTHKKSKDYHNYALVYGGE